MTVFSVQSRIEFSERDVASQTIYKETGVCQCNPRARDTEDLRGAHVTRMKLNGFLDGAFRRVPITHVWSVYLGIWLPAYVCVCICADLFVHYRVLDRRQGSSSNAERHADKRVHGRLSPFRQCPLKNDFRLPDRFRSRHANKSGMLSVSLRD